MWQQKLSDCADNNYELVVQLSVVFNAYGVVQS